MGTGLPMGSKGAYAPPSGLSRTVAIQLQQQALGATVIGLPPATAATVPAAGTAVGKGGGSCGAGGAGGGLGPPSRPLFPPPLPLGAGSLPGLGGGEPGVGGCGPHPLQHPAPAGDTDAAGGGWALDSTWKVTHLSSAVQHSAATSLPPPSGRGGGGRGSGGSGRRGRPLKGRRGGSFWPGEGARRPSWQRPRSPLPVLGPPARAATLHHHPYRPHPSPGLAAGAGGGWGAPGLADAPSGVTVSGGCPAGANTQCCAPAGQAGGAGGVLPAGGEGGGWRPPSLSRPPRQARRMPPAQVPVGRSSRRRSLRCLACRAAPTPPLPPPRQRRLPLPTDARSKTWYIVWRLVCGTPWHAAIG